MKRSRSLPAPPDVALELLEDLSPPGEGFLKHRRRRLRASSADGPSAPFVYDEVDRRALDAVVVAPHFQEPQGIHWVVLRSAVRPPVSLRDASRSPIDEPPNRALWELPAGLVEPGERDEDGLRRAGARELLEETGFDVPPDRLQELGPSTFPAPGIIAERHFFYEARVDPAARREPPLDGSVLESLGVLVAVPLAVALDAARAGRLADAKTELALRRLSERLAASKNPGGGS